MKITLFLVGSFLAIHFMAFVRMASLGWFDRHRGVLGSLLESMPSSFVAAAVTTAAFGLASLLAKRSRTGRAALILGVLAGLASFAAGWAFADYLDDFAEVLVLLPFAVVGGLAAFVGRPRGG